MSLKSRGYSDGYLTSMVNSLKCLARNVSLDNPVAVSMWIAKAAWKDSYKANVCDYYNHYVKANNLSWIKPRYNREHKLPIVPTTERINVIISHASISAF